MIFGPPPFASGVHMGGADAAGAASDDDDDDALPETAGAPRGQQRQ